MNIHKYLMILYVGLVLCSIARGIPVITSIPISVYKSVIMAMSILYVVLTFRLRLPLFAKCLLLFIILITIHFCGADESTYNNTTFSNTIIPLLSFFPAFYYARNGLVSDKCMSIFSYILLAIIIVSFNKSQQTALNELIYETSNITNNYGYFFASFIPLIFFREKTVVQLLLFFICMVGSIMAAKRGVILSTSICFAFYIFYYLKQIKTGSRIKRIFINIMFLTALWVGIHYLYLYSVDSSAFMTRLEKTQEGDTSGRDMIISELWQIISMQHDFNLVFGNGYSAVRNAIGIEAHNDWFEILMDYGIIGFVIYFSMILSLIVFTVKCRIARFKYALIAGIAIWLIKSMFSMSFNNYNSIILMMIFGYVFGIYSDKKQIYYENNMSN